ncbi:MAG: hypothetical protein AAF078_12010, partial [Planctomycetota bacterium]
MATRDELEDTVAGWILEDVETFLDDRHSKIETDLASRPRVKPKPVVDERARNEDSLYPTAAHGAIDAQVQWARKRRGPQPHGPRWERLSRNLRRTLESWVKLETNEVFRHFYADMFCEAERRGEEGVVLTDRRLVYHHGLRRGEAVRWSPDAVVQVNSRGSNVLLTHHKTRSRVHVATLDHGSAERLIAALKRGGGFTVTH